MPDFKVVIQYTEVEKGFQEVYYRNATNLQAAATFDTDFTYAMTSFRNPLVQLSKIRVSDVLNLRATQLVTFNLSSHYNPGTPQASGLCAVFQLNGLSPGGSRQLRLRGLNTQDTIRDPSSGAYSMSGELTLRTNYMLAGLQRRNFEIRSLVPVANTPSTWPKITSLTAVANSQQTTLNFNPGFTGIVGNYIKVSQVNQKAWPGLNGIFQILALTSTSVTIAYNSLQTVTAQTLTKGRFKAVSYQYGVIDSTRSGFSVFATRITGKSPLGGRGRRPGLKLRLA